MIFVCVNTPSKQRIANWRYIFNYVNVKWFQISHLILLQSESKFCFLESGGIWIPICTFANSVSEWCQNRRFVMNSSFLVCPISVGTSIVSNEPSRELRMKHRTCKIAWLVCGFVIEHLEFHLLSRYDSVIQYDWRHTFCFSLTLMSPISRNRNIDPCCVATRD